MTHAQYASSPYWVISSTNVWRQRQNIISESGTYDRFVISSSLSLNLEQEFVDQSLCAVKCEGLKSEAIIKFWIWTMFMIVMFLCLNVLF